MKYYMIVETNVSNPSWIAEYLAKVTPMVEHFGGRYLTRTPRVLLLEGEGQAPQFSLLAQFPSKDAALSFYNSEEYAPFKEARQAGSRSKFLLVPAEGIDQ